MISSGKKVRYIIYWGFFLAAIISAGQAISQTKTYDLQSAIDYSIKHNRELKLANLEIERANAAVREAYGYALPTVDLSASLSHFLEKAKMPFPDFRALLTNSTYGVLFDEGLLPRDESKFLPMETSLQSFALANNYEAALNVSQILFNSAVFTGIGSAGKYLETSKVMFKAQMSKTVLNVQKAFYSALLMKEMNTVIKSSFTTFEATVKNIKLLYDEGMVSEYDYLQMKVQLENFKPRVIEADNGYQLSLDVLKMAMAMDKSEVIDITGSYDLSQIDVPNYEATVSEAMSKNLDIMSLEYKKMIDEAMVDLEKANYFPTIAAFGNITYAGTADDFNFLHYNSSLVGLNLSINLYNGGRTNNKVQQQLINVYKTNEQIKTLRDGIALNVKSKILDLQRIRENINSTVENVALSERAYNIAEIRLKEGSGTQLELINAEQAKRDAILNKYRAINDYYNAKFELDNLLGNLDQKYIKNFESNLK